MRDNAAHSTEVQPGNPDIRARPVYMVYRRRLPMLPALIFGVLQIAAGLDTLFTNYILPRGESVLTSIAAVLFLLLGLLLTAFVLVSLLRPTPLIEVTVEGLALSISKPGEPPVLVPWDALKIVELGHAGPDKNRKGDPPCLVLRYNGTRVRRPAQLYGVFHSTRGSLFLRASHIPKPDEVVRQLAHYQRLYQGN